MSLLLLLLSFIPLGRAEVPRRSGALGTVPKRDHSLPNKLWQPPGVGRGLCALVRALGEELSLDFSPREVERPATPDVCRKEREGKSLSFAWE